MGIVISNGGILTIESGTLSNSGSAGPAAPVDTYSPVVLADTPFGFWRLDEASGLVINDSSGNANHGTIEGGVPQGNGIVYQESSVINFGYSMTKGEAGSYFSVPDPSIGAGGDWSVECWFNQDAGGGTAVDCIFYQDDSPFTSVNAFVCVYDENFGGGIERVRMFLNGVAVVSTANNTAPLGTDVHLVVTYEDATTTTTVYINGVSEGSDSAEAAPNLTGNFLFGLRNASDLDMTGRMDELAIYNSLLSPTRVLAHYNAGI